MSIHLRIIDERIHTDSTVEGMYTRIADKRIRTHWTRHMNEDQTKSLERYWLVELTAHFKKMVSPHIRRITELRIRKVAKKLLNTMSRCESGYKCVCVHDIHVLAGNRAGTCFIKREKYLYRVSMLWCVSRTTNPTTPLLDDVLIKTSEDTAL